MYIHLREVSCNSLSKVVVKGPAIFNNIRLLDWAIFALELSTGLGEVS